VANPAVRTALDANAALLLEELNIKKWNSPRTRSLCSYEVKRISRYSGTLRRADQTNRRPVAKGDGAAFFAQLQENRAIALDWTAKPFNS
jgi:hypothetical protein